MALSKNEKEQLLIFIKSHYVDYHDVRLLIARDLEEDMTQLMKEDENLSFSDALDQAYKKYGVIGFSDVSEEYIKKIDHYFRKEVLMKIVINETSKIKFWFLVIFSYFLIFLIIAYLKSFPLMLGIGFLIVVISGLTFYFRKTHKKIKALKQRDKFLYFDEIVVSNFSLIFPLTYTPLLIAPHLGILIENADFSIAIIAFLAMISFISPYLIYYRLYKNRSQFLQDYQDNYLSEKINFKLDLI